MTDSSPLVTQASPRHVGLVVALLGAISTLGPAGMDLYMPALPKVASGLGASNAAIALTMTAFLVGWGIGTLFSGSLSDRYGRRRPLLVGLVVYALAALGCALAPSVGVLIAMRFVLGAASSGGNSIGQAVVADYARGTQAARLMSRLALVSYVAPIMAPPIGAQLLRVTSWRGIYVVLAVAGAGFFVAALRVVGESLPLERRIRSGMKSTLRISANLLHDSHFVGLLVAAAFASAAFYAYLTGVSLVFQDEAGLTATAFSILFTVNAGGMLAATQVNHWLLARFSPRQLLGGSLALSAVAGAGAFAASFTHPLHVPALAVPLFLFVAGMAALMPNAAALAISLHPDTAGSASAVFGSSGMVLGALATPLVGVGGVGALSMTLVIVVAAFAALAVYVVGPRRYPDTPGAAELESTGDAFQT